MRLVSFRIKNFKSIIDTGTCHFSPGDNILVLAGQNEAGKSAVIEALDFFANGPSDDFERLQRRQDTLPTVTCEYLLSDHDIEEICQEFKNVAFSSHLQQHPIIGFVRDGGETQIATPVAFTDDTRQTWHELLTLLPSSPTEELNEEQQIDNTEDQPPPGLVTMSKNLESIQGHLWNLSREFVFYDTFANLLPGVVSIDRLDDYPAVTDFQKVFHVNFADIVKLDERAIGREEMRLNQEASDDLNKYWKQRLEAGGEYNFNVKIVPQEQLVKSKIEFKIDRKDGDPLFIEQKSKGFRWFSAFNLRLRAMGVGDTEIHNMVILIDEPGQGLHEKAQRDVKLVLEELAKEKGAQVIYTTHYPNLIGTEGQEFARLRVVSNTKEAGTKVETAAQYASRADHQGAQDTLSPVVTAMGLNSIHSVLDTARFNVVVEGISDHYYLTAFRELLDKDKRLYFLPACGVNNISNLVSVLIGWGCNYKAVLDDDAKSGRTAYRHLRDRLYEKDDDYAHEHIFKILGCNGIEDVLSKSDFRKYVLGANPRSNVAGANSFLANGKKELYGRLFLEKAMAGDVALNTQSRTKISSIFIWLYKQFGIPEK